MKDFLEKNIVLKVLAVLLAILVWFLARGFVLK